MSKEILSMPAIDEGKYRGEWLALDPKTHQIIAHGVALKKVAKEAKAKGYENPVFHGVPKSDIHFVTVE